MTSRLPLYLASIAMLTTTTVAAGGCGASQRRAPSTPTAVADAPVTYLDVNGALLAAAPDGAGGWFIGGRFTRVAGQPRAGLAHIRADGGLDPSWKPAVQGSAPRFRTSPPDTAYVLALGVVDGTVYVGGVFASINGRPRRYLGAVNARTGRVLAWNPRPNWQVNALAAAAGRLYAGGDFTRIGGARRGRLAAFDADTGALTAWKPTVTGRRWSAADPTVSVLVVDSGRLYVGGMFTSAGGRDRNGLAAFDIASGALNAWNPGYVYPSAAVAVAGNRVYVGGTFLGVGREPDEFERTALAALDARTGRVLPWRADAILGREQADANDPGLIDALAVVGDHLYVGGTFVELAGELSENVGVVSATTGASIPWELPPGDSDYSLVAGGDRVLVGVQVQQP